MEGLGSRPDADLDVLKSTDRVVAVMNAEPIRAALADGADVVIAGRASDCALFAAPLLNAGHGPGISYLTGKLMECASFCAEPYMAKESIMGLVQDDAVHLTAMHPNQRCTPESVAGHSLYERQDPFHEHVAGGCLDMSSCIYTQEDDGPPRQREQNSSRLLFAGSNWRGRARWENAAWPLSAFATPKRLPESTRRSTGRERNWRSDLENRAMVIRLISTHMDGTA